LKIVNWATLPRFHILNKIILRLTMQRATGRDQRKERLLLDLLWKACNAGDYGMLQRLLEKHDEERGGGVDVSELGVSPLFANIHGHNEGRTALYASCFSGHHACASLLLDHGLDVNQLDNNRITALNIAGQQGQHACASLLLDHGFDVNRVDNNGGSALHIASHHGQHACASLLLDRSKYDKSQCEMCVPPSGKWCRGDGS